MQPNQVFHYKFTIPDAAAASNKGNNRFYLGYYVPGAGEPDFTFYVAVFGMRNSTNCSQWGDGWGRRRRLGGGDDHAHNTAPTTPITAPDSGVITPHRITSSGTAWLMDSNDIPERVSGKNDGHDHDHDGQFNYHKAADTLTFIASPATNRPNKVRESGGCGRAGGAGERGVRRACSLYCTWYFSLPLMCWSEVPRILVLRVSPYTPHRPFSLSTAIPAPPSSPQFESFSPTLFKPRGSCIADFPRGGEYRMSVWGEVGQVGAKKFSVGIGLAERDVFAPVNLMTFDYLLFPIQEWNGWNGFVLILPLLLGVLAAIATIMVKRKLRHYDAHTSTGFPTPFRALVLVCSGALLGHLVMNISILAWATRNATIHNGREMMFPLLMGIIMPLLSGSSTLLVGLLPRSCCCCGAKSAAASPGYGLC